MTWRPALPEPPVKTIRFNVDADIAVVSIDTVWDEGDAKDAFESQ